MLQDERMQAKTIMRAIDEVMQTQTIAQATNIIEFKQSIQRISSLTSQDENDTGFIIYSGIQNLVQDKKSYPTIDIPLLRKQVALQLAMNKYIEFQPIYQPMVK